MFGDELEESKTATKRRRKRLADKKARLQKALLEFAKQGR
jgi:hypothetical protein